MCFLFDCSESCFYKFGRIDWDRLRLGGRAGLAYKSVTGDSPFLIQNDYNSLPFNHESIIMKIMKDYFMETAKIV